MHKAIIVIILSGIVGCGSDNIRRDSAGVGEAEVRDLSAYSEYEWKSMLDSLEVPESVDEMAEMVTEKQPIYPKESRRRGDKGTVFVEALVDETGRVIAARTIRSSLYPALDRATLEAAYQNRFEPATISGEPVKSVVKYRVDFHLEYAR